MQIIKLVKKFFSSPVYYFFLLIKKTRIAVHNKTEKKVNSSESSNKDMLLTFLWQNVLNNLKYSPSGYFFSSNVTNKNVPMVLSQIRIILILCSKTDNPKYKSDYLVKSMADFLISLREKERGLFKFNQASWNLQDEGIASVWATLALIKAYESTNSEKYLDVAKSTIKSMMTHLYKKETSLLHTEGEHFWCLNAASTFADVCAQLLKHSYSDEVKEAMEDSIQLCIGKIAEDGHYPYNYVRPGTYLLLYHPIVMITLNNCLESEYLSQDLKEKIISANKKAEDFLITCIDNENRIFETEITHYGQYIITNITSLLALKGKVSPEFESSLLKSISSHYSHNKLYLCKTEHGKLFDSDLYQVSDVLAVEVLYWLDIYLES